VLSDDSGLEIAALAGLPGVNSSSWGGEEGNHAKNNEKLVAQMRNQTNMHARFVCTLCLISPTGKIHFFDGECAGLISVDAKGQKGFGYDPHFIPAGFSKSMAELTPDEKNQISHRGKALEKLEAFLQKLAPSAVFVAANVISFFSIK
jgi:XTP/dITP diphosphohydrolase